MSAIPNTDFEEIVILITKIEKQYCPLIGCKDFKDDQLVETIRRRFKADLQQLTEVIANV